MLPINPFKPINTDTMLYTIEFNAATKKNYPAYKYILLIGMRPYVVSVSDCTLNIYQEWIWNNLFGAIESYVHSTMASMSFKMPDEFLWEMYDWSRGL